MVVDAYVTCLVASAPLRLFFTLCQVSTLDHGFRCVDPWCPSTPIVKYFIHQHPLDDVRLLPLSASEGVTIINPSQFTPTETCLNRD